MTTRVRNRSSDAIYYDGCTCVGETPKAIKVDIPDLGEEQWIPKSQVHDDSEVYAKGDEGTLAVTNWFAKNLEGGGDGESAS